MTTAVNSSTSKPVTAAVSTQAPVLPKYPPPPTVSFRSLLFGDAAVAEPLLDAPPPLPLSSLLMPQLPVAPQAPHGAQDAGKAEETQIAPDALLRVAHGRDDDLFDPFRRQRAAFGPPETLSSSGVATSPSASAPPTAQATETVRSQATLEDLIPALVRRVQWGGDGRKGTVRMELGAGALAGATLQVSSDHGRVSVHLDVPPGVDAAQWRERITARLAAQNIATDHVEVT